MGINRGEWEMRKEIVYRRRATNLARQTMQTK